jgi:hypothetical protein
VDGLLQQREGVSGASGLAEEHAEGQEGVGVAGLEAQGVLEVLGGDIASSAGGQDRGEASA